MAEITEDDSKVERGIDESLHTADDKGMVRAMNVAIANCQRTYYSFNSKIVVDSRLDSRVECQPPRALCR